MVYSPHTRTLLRYPGTPLYQVPVDRSNGTCYQYRYCRYLCAQYWSTRELLVLASTTGLTGSLIYPVCIFGQIFAIFGHPRNSQDIVICIHTYLWYFTMHCYYSTPSIPVAIIMYIYRYTVNHMWL